MKKITTILLLLTLAFGVMAFAACGDKPTESGSVSTGTLGDGADTDEDIDVPASAENDPDAADVKYFKFELYGNSMSKGYMITGWSDVTDARPTEIIFPTAYNKLPVVGIAQGAFRNDKTITKITLGDSFRLIKKRAFCGCENIESVNLSAKITKIAASAFRDCKKLTSVAVPEKITRLYGSTFSGCESLVSVTLPEKLVYLGVKVFEGCKALKSVEIPKSVTEIGTACFMNSGIEKISLSLTGIKAIPVDCFSGCENLTSVAASKVTKVGLGAFYGCGKLKSVTVSSNCEFGMLSLTFKGCPEDVKVNNKPLSDIEIITPPSEDTGA